MNRIPPMRIFELGYGLAGLILIAWAGMSIPSEWYLTTVGLLAAAAALTPYSIRLNDPVRLPGAMPLEISVLLLAPPPVSILVAGATNLFTSIRYRRPVSRTLFNVANLAIPNALAGLLLVAAINRWPRVLDVPTDLPVVAGAIAVRMVVNLLGTAGVQYLERRIPRYWAWVGLSLVDEWRAGGFGIRLLPVLMALSYPVAGWWALGLGGLLQFAIGGSMQRYQDRIDRQSLLDGLTGLSNRKAWEQYITGTQRAAPHVVAVIDVDGLKRTNDTYGHDKGDAILLDLAQRMRNLANQIHGCRVFRIGGDEFVVTCPNLQAEEAFQAALKQLIESYSRHWWSLAIPASASVGFASCPAEAPDIVLAFSLADQRMYQTKPRMTGGSLH